MNSRPETVRVSSSRLSGAMPGAQSMPNSALYSVTSAL